MLLWYVQGNVGYYHLGAYSSEGYKLNVSFALFWTLLDYFSKEGLQWLSLGAGAGINGDENDGLTRFNEAGQRVFELRIFVGVFLTIKNISRSLHPKAAHLQNSFPPTVWVSSKIIMEERNLT
ncbi:MAG: hypothetical protein IPJ20_23890 [Flammeovirgaceae bacterium]|nr:hypothetical protein [Flammeovirgaceae bacterium]